MKLKATQIIGLVAIIVFGGGLIVRLTQPSEREVMERRLASLPSIPSPRVELPGIVVPTPPVPNPDAVPGIAADAVVGSPDAWDDFYCWAVLNKEFEARIKTDADSAAPLLDAQRLLEAAGIAKFEAEGVTARDDWASMTVAYAQAARADFRNKTLRIPVADCIDRASKLSQADR